MADFYLAEVNVARWKIDPESPEAAFFINNLDRVNTLAENSPGFVWRLLDESDNPFDSNMIVTLSLWENPKSLRDFVYRSWHKNVLARREEWFAAMDAPGMALWWCPADHRPDLHEAQSRLAILEREGPSQQAFGFNNLFPMPELV